MRLDVLYFAWVRERIGLPKEQVETEAATVADLVAELVLREEGVTDFSAYAPGAKGPLAADFFVPDEVFSKTDTKLAGMAG